jgi:alkylhydroperoxidase/carboxymuconolactone decarboxylase family protein YurZ
VVPFGESVGGGFDQRTFVASEGLASSALCAGACLRRRPYYFKLALNNGVKPSELSEVITHLTFHSGWSNALSAVAIAKDIFEQRRIGPDELPPASPELLLLNEAAESELAMRVQEDVGNVAPGVVQYTTDLLFRDLWLRPALAPRDRSLVTVSALIASGQVAQVTYHLNRAMDNGLTKSQASEVLTQLGFYAGWPNVFSALPVAKDVMDVFEYGEESVSVGFEEVSSRDWAKEVYKPISRISGTSSTRNLDTRCEAGQRQMKGRKNNERRSSLRTPRCAFRGARHAEDR